MSHIKTSNKIFLCLVIVYALTAYLSIFLPMGTFGPTAADYAKFSVSKPILALINAIAVLIIYGGLGFLGLILARKLGFPEIWDPKVSNKQRFLQPALIGAGCGIFLIIGDFIFSKYNTIGHFPHPAFPASINASLAAGIGEEMIFRLFFISFWLWLISYVILKKRWTKQIFWIMAVISALAFAIGHYPAVMMMLGYKSFADIPLVLQLEMILLNGLIGILTAVNFRKYGFLAAVGIHFWTDIVWHVIFGAIIS